MAKRNQQVETYWGIRIGKHPRNLPYLMIVHVPPGQPGHNAPHLFNSRGDARAFRVLNKIDGRVVRVRVQFDA
jgi:hypothetical protein